MEDNELKDILRRAAELASAVPEPLREAAFKSAFDALMGTTSRSGGGTSKSVGSPSSTKRQRGGERSDDSDDEFLKLIQDIDRTAYPEIKQAKKALDLALIVLHAASKDLNVEWVTSKGIAAALKEKFRLPTNERAIYMALDRAGDKVDRATRDGKVYFRLMGPGEDYVATIGTKEVAKGSSEVAKVPTPIRHEQKSSGSGKSGGGGRARESYSLDRNLNLRGGGNVPSFRDFYESKKPKTKAQFNAVAVYYLQKTLGLETISLNQVFTCYKEVGERPAEHFKQSFIDARSNYGWVDFDKEWNLSIPHRGQIFVEHDLPAAPKKK